MLTTAGARLNLWLRFRDFYRELGLTDKQIEEFENAVGRNMQSPDGFFTMHEGHFGAELERGLLRAYVLGWERTATEVLGERAAEPIREALRISSIQSEVDKVALNCLDEWARLSEDQSKKLIEVCLDTASAPKDLKLRPASVNWGGYRECTLLS